MTHISTLLTVDPPVAQYLEHPNSNSEIRACELRGAYHLHGKTGNSGWKSSGLRHSVWEGSENTSGDTGGSRGGARGARAPLLFLDQTEAPKGRKKFFWRPPPPPPYLKVYIRPWIRAVICDDAVFLLVAVQSVCSADLNKLCSRSFSNLGKFYFI